MECSKVINISVNNKLMEIKFNASVHDLIKLIGFSNNVAVFVNKKQVLLKEYPNFSLNNGDNVYIFKPLGGG